MSILSDGSTDKGILEEEIVYTRYIKHGRPVTNLIKVQLPDSVDAAGITKAIQEAINSLKPEDGPNDFMENFYQKLINVNFDGASVMSGHKSGVQKRLKDIQPGLIYTHCVAHRLELAMLDALKLKDDYLHRFDENINGLFKFYYYSPIRRKELKDMASEIEVEFKQFGLLKNIRWLASRSRVLQILEHNYLAIVYDLESKSYGTDETANKARGFLSFVKKTKFLFYLHFFQDFVESLKQLSLIFQKKELLICEVPLLLDEKITNIGVINEIGDGLKRLMKNLTENTNSEISYKNDVILSLVQWKKRKSST